MSGERGEVCFEQYSSNNWILTQLLYCYVGFYVLLKIVNCKHIPWCTCLKNIFQAMSTLIRVNLKTHLFLYGVFVQRIPSFSKRINLKTVFSPCSVNWEIGDIQKLFFFLVMWHNHVTHSTQNKQDGGWCTEVVAPAIQFDRFVKD